MEEVFEADGAVVPHGSHHTFMVVAERERVAAPAMLAVEEILTPSDAADACVGSRQRWRVTEEVGLLGKRRGGQGRLDGKVEGEVFEG